MVASFENKKLETRFIDVIKIGKRLIEIAPILINASGFARFEIGPRDAPSRIDNLERNWYAAVKNGICKRRETEPFNAEIGE